MRGWLADKSNYSKPILVGDVMRSLASGKVVASRNPHYSVGDWVTGWFGWQETAEVSEADILRKIGETDLPLSLSLGILGLNGLAAISGLLSQVNPVPERPSSYPPPPARSDRQSDKSQRSWVAGRSGSREARTK
jgi:NADPH-dependent curcumin reductase CurA